LVQVFAPVPVSVHAGVAFLALSPAQV